MSMSVSAETAPSNGLDPRSLGKGLAALRIFFGLILFSNGLAKLFSFRDIEIGPYASFLINREEARSILQGEAGKTELPLLPSLVNDFIIPNWGFFQWVVTALEVGVGAALIVGLATRLAALIGLGQALFLQLMYLSSGAWMWEQPHEWVPLLILVLVPAGRVWGLDHRFVHRGSGRLRGFPF
jgi:uncharacterized membrane protein YphA (DoxX/SURF4 family)